MATLFSFSLFDLTTFSPQSFSSTLRLHSDHRYTFCLRHKKSPFLRFSSEAINEGVSAVIEVDDKLAAKKVPESSEVDVVRPSEISEGNNGSAEAVGGAVSAKVATRFEDARWVKGTWDLDRFQTDGKTNWDAVIDAEVFRRKWLEKNPEASINGEPVVFDTEIIPWWAWMKRFHLPEAEKLNGRAAMIGFFMAYVVDSLTGLGIVDQTDNWVCKTLLLLTLSGVLLIRKNDDFGTLKKLVEETTLYDKQWQASWKDDGFKD